MFPPYRQNVNLHIVSLEDAVSVKEYRRLEKKSKRQTLALGISIGIIAYIVQRDIVNSNKKDGK